MRHAMLIALLVAGCAAPGVPISAEASPPAQAPDLQVKLEVESLLLPNGMTFLFAPRKGAPVFTGYIAFKVGGVDNATGETGMSHMFEHMAFKGTEHIGTTDWEKERVAYEALARTGDALTRLRATGRGTPEELARLEAEVKRLDEEQHRTIVKDEIDRIYSSAGGKNLNANTSMDSTQYFVSLPSNALELWMLVESQRMAKPALREFFTEREVIAQERLMRYENDPIGKLYERFVATAFLVAPYRNPGIGWASDIPALTMAGARRFHAAYYSPSNAVAVLCGDFDLPLAKTLAARYFGAIPRGADPPPVVTREPKQDAERRAEVVFDANPFLFIGFHKPCFPHRDDAVLDVVQVLLGGGVTSRLYRRLVEKEGLAFVAEASNGIPGARYDNLFSVICMPSAGASPDRVEQVVTEELDRLKVEPVPPAELEKAKTRIAAGFVKGLAEHGGTCATLATYHMMAGDWRAYEAYLAGILSVTAEEVRGAAARTFLPANRTVARLVPPPPAPEAPAPKEAQP